MLKSNKQPKQKKRNPDGVADQMGTSWHWQRNLRARLKINQEWHRYTTQYLYGRGNFNAYLHRFRLRAEPCGGNNLVCFTHERIPTFCFRTRSIKQKIPYGQTLLTKRTIRKNCSTSWQNEKQQRLRRTTETGRRHTSARIKEKNGTIKLIKVSCIVRVYAWVCIIITCTYYNVHYS